MKAKTRLKIDGLVTSFAMGFISAVYILLAIALVVVEMLVVFGAAACFGSGRIDNGLSLVALAAIQTPVVYLTVKSLFIK